MKRTTEDVRNLMIERHVDIPYYENAEAWLEPFWGADSVFRREFGKLDLSTVTEIACGHGRHSAQVIEHIGTLTLVDVNRPNIDACRNRFSGYPRTKYLVNDGSSLAGIRDGSQSAVFSYDAMVHFEASDVISYLTEIARILRIGGLALLHYSNNESPGIDPFSDPAWRNYFSRSMMLHFASRNGLSAIADHVIPWAGRQSIDGLILLEKVDACSGPTPERPRGFASRLLTKFLG